MNNKIIHEDVNMLIRQDSIQFEKLREKSFLITGGTGLIGSNIIHALCIISQELDLNLEVTGIVRNHSRAKKIFPNYKNLTLIEKDLVNYSITNKHYDYILHIASPTASNYFVSNPVELIDFAYTSTKKLLEQSIASKATFVYFSSMEVYGTPVVENPIDENSTASCPNCLSIRSSYSESKRLCENMCKAFEAEYGIPCIILRLAQTFGPGVKKNDNRVFAQFAHSCCQGKDIVLKTKGDSKRCYLYPMDMVSALLTIISHKKSNNTYNVANEDTYCSIIDLAKVAIETLGQGNNHIVFNLDDSGIYPPSSCLKLDCTRLKSLGWHPKYNLKDMFKRLVASWESDDL